MLKELTTTNHERTLFAFSRFTFGFFILKRRLIHIYTYHEYFVMPKQASTKLTAEGKFIAATDRCASCGLSCERIWYSMSRF
jgi:hypothetical protein